MFSKNGYIFSNLTEISILLHSFGEVKTLFLLPLFNKIIISYMVTHAVQTGLKPMIPLLPQPPKCFGIRGISYQARWEGLRKNLSIPKNTVLCFRVLYNRAYFFRTSSE